MRKPDEDEPYWEFLETHQGHGIEIHERTAYCPICKEFSLLKPEGDPA